MCLYSEFICNKVNKFFCQWQVMYGSNIGSLRELEKKDSSKERFKTLEDLTKDWTNNFIINNFIIN